MPKRWKRAGRRAKYSIEQTLVHPPITYGSGSDWTFVDGDQMQGPSYQWNVTVVEPTTIQGTRKAKHFELSFSVADIDDPIAYALVFVPEGYSANPIRVPAPNYYMTLYEPAQYVISQGVLDFSGGPCRIRTPLSRNMNSGDKIVLILAVPSEEQETAQNINMYATVKYAITMN